MEGSKGKIILGLRSPDFALVLGILIFETFHGQISLLHQLALDFVPSIQQAPQIGSMSSIGGSKVTGQFLHLGLELDLNLGKPSVLSFGAVKLGILLSELASSSAIFVLAASFSPSWLSSSANFSWRPPARRRQQQWLSKKHSQSRSARARKSNQSGGTR